MFKPIGIGRFEIRLEAKLLLRKIIFIFWLVPLLWSFWTD